LVVVEKVQTGRKDDLGDGEVADGAVVAVVIVKVLKDRVRKGVVRHGDTVQRTDNIFRLRPMMMVEGFGAGHAAEREQQHPRDQLSHSCLLHGGKNTFFFTRRKKSIFGAWMGFCDAWKQIVATLLSVAL
jgi:hypothetical protein